MIEMDFMHIDSAERNQELELGPAGAGDARTVNPGQRVTYVETRPLSFVGLADALFSALAEQATATPKVGDVVHLKTSSPPMTVEYIETAGEQTMIGLVWFTCSVLHRAKFPKEMLR